jgi:inner membrane protein
MSEEPNYLSQIPKLLNLLKDSLMLKIAIIGIIISLLYIPKSLILELIAEREQRSDEVIETIHQKWGGSQSLHGPILSIPIHSEKGQQFIHLHPEELDIQGQIHPEERKKSIFNTIVYKSEVDYSFTFDLRAIKDLAQQPNLQFDKAILSFGISDLKGLSRSISLKIDDKELAARPSIPVNNGLKNGFHFPLELDPQQALFTMSTNLQFNGSQQLSLSPNGRKTIIQLQSSWPHPGFEGKYLPDSYTISDTGFDSHWEVHDLQRNFVSLWRDNEQKMTPEACTVRLIQFNGSYTQVHRLVKYTLLFLCFTFAAIFICERLSQQIIHPLQYILFGFASLMFYVLLLSISEHLNFMYAYLIASITSTLMISLYSLSLLKNWKNSSSIALTTGGLYAYLYGTIQLEDYALLMGSLGLIITLAVVMYFTRDLNSYKEIEA